MKIITPAEIEKVAWQGKLVSPQVTVTRGPSPLEEALVTLGEPVWWPAEQAMESQISKKWTPPADKRRYLLVRLACTLHPPAGSHTHYFDATLSVKLSAMRGDPNVRADDLFPMRLAVDSKHNFSFKLTPGLKFAETLEANLLEAGADIDYVKTFPVIQGFGLGESQPYWRFSKHAKYPLLGSQCVYAVVSAPPNAAGIQFHFDLTATLETRFGPIRYGLPTDVQNSLQRNYSFSS